MKNLPLTISLFVSFCFFTCQKDISITPPKASFTSKLFIESILIPGEIPKVFISNSLPFFSKEVTPQEVFARNAEVIITDNEGVMDVLEADSTFDQFRCRWLPFYQGSHLAKFNTTYTLSINYEGQSYTATTTIEQAKVSIDTISYIAEFFDIYGGHDGVVIKFRDVPGEQNYYRSQMNRMIDTSRHHAHVLDVIKNDCTNGERFLNIDYGRTIFNDQNIDGQLLEVNIEVSFEYLEGDSAIVYIQSLDAKAAKFYQDLDDQLAAIQNPFVEPVFLDSEIDGAIGVFGSAVLSDPVLFIYPQDNP